jgi:voltage-gated potassium channel
MPARRHRLKLQSEIVIIFALLIVIWTGGTIFYHFVEGLQLVDAIYLAAMTLTTVGYGDFSPQTDIGKIFTAVYAFVGIGIFLGFAAALFQLIATGLRRRK